jgi:HK97 family phage major capsid protein
MEITKIQQIAADMGLSCDDAAAKKIQTAIEGKTGSERSVELAKQFAVLQGSAPAPAPEVFGNGGNHFHFTNEQVEQLAKAGAFGMHQQVEEIVTKVAQKFGTTVSDAKAAAGVAVKSRMQQALQQMKENKTQAEIFRQLFLYKKGETTMEQVKQAYVAEAEFLGRDTAFTQNMKEQAARLKTQAMSVGTDTAGGYLSPEIFSTRVYERLERYGVARQFCTLIPMEGEIMHIPTLDADVTAADTAEGVEGAESDITIGRKTLQPRKQMVLAGPFSDELLINAEPGIIGILQESAARALAKLEDNHVFIGTSAAFTGLLELTAKVHTLATGVAITDLDVDDMIDLIAVLDDRYVTEEARFFWNKAVTTTLRKVKSDSQYLWGNTTNPAERNLLGYGYTHVPDMPSAPAVTDKFAVFGDLSNVWLGLRGGLRLDLLTEGSIDVNGTVVHLGATAQYALRVIEYFDSEVIDANAIAVLKRNAA